MIPVFILTYEGIGCLDSWFDPGKYSDDIKIFIVDNGRQVIPDRLKPYVSYVTERNIGCAGGYNLMLDIGFDMGVPYVIVAQDDGPFTEEQIRNIANALEGGSHPSLYLDDRLHHIQRGCSIAASQNALIGLFGNGFSFAIMGIRKDHRDVVGRFDENYISLRREDEDYINRCKLLGIGVYHFNESTIGKVSQIPNDNIMSFHQNNIDYYYAKWGYGENYAHPFDMPQFEPNDTMPISDKVREVFGDIEEFPSETEFKRYKRLQNGR